MEYNRNFSIPDAYNFLSQNGLIQESTEIKTSSDKFKSYTSTLRRAKIIVLVRDKNLLEKFCDTVWQSGLADKGKSRIRFFENLVERLSSDQEGITSEDEEVEIQTESTNLISTPLPKKKEISMSRIITRPAAIVKQGNLKLYTTSLRVADLLMDKFYDIERLEPENPDDKGFQRVLNKGRAKKLADYLIAGQDNHDAFLPTSVFLATDKDISFDPDTNTITFDVDKIGPFSVVDGQHRIEGLKLAAEKKPSVLSFEVPVNIGVNLPKIAQMCHFLIVNTTQKSVDKAVEQRIYARLSEVIDFEDVPNLPKWIQRIVESGDDEVALKIADYLNETSESIWYGKIEMANQEVKSSTINQKSFVKFLKKYVLTANNPIIIQYSSDQYKKIILNYWNAIANILDINKPTVLFKYVGVELFCRFSIPVFNKLINIGNFKVTTIEKILRDTFDNIDGENAGLGHPEWWLSSTGVAGGLNSTASGKILQEMIKALHKTNTSVELEL